MLLGLHSCGKRTIFSSFPPSPPPPGLSSSATSCTRLGRQPCQVPGPVTGMCTDTHREPVVRKPGLSKFPWPSSSLCTLGKRLSLAAVTSVTTTSLNVMARETAASRGEGERERGRERQWLFFETGCPKNITTPLPVSSGSAQFLPSREDHTGFARAFRPAAERRSLGPAAPGSRCAAA